MPSALKAVLWGTGAGVAAGVVAWFFAARALDKRFEAGGADLQRELDRGGAELGQRLQAGRTQLEQELRAQVDAQVPPVVRDEVVQTLSLYGITPATGRQIASALEQASRLGLL